MEATRGNGYAPVWGSLVMMMMGDGRLSWPGWLGTYPDRLLASRQSPIQVVTGPDVEQLR